MANGSGLIAKLHLLQKPVVALDIDGTLGDYHGHFLRFAADWYGRPMPDPKEITGGVPLYTWMGTSRSTYRDCKLAFRQGGLKRSMPAYPGASAVTRQIRKLGIDVWICTTRPYLRLDNIDPDTRHWLRRNGISYDGVIFGQRKYAELARIVGSEKILFVVDDLPEQVASAEKLGLSASLRDQPYNRHIEARLRIFDLFDIPELFERI